MIINNPSVSVGYYYYASDTLRQSNNAEKVTNSTIYAKVKEILVATGFLVSFRVIFDLFNTGTTGVTNSKAKIYINGVAKGTERTFVANGAYVTQPAEDFWGVNVGDKIQIYALVSDGAQEVRVKNMRLYYDAVSTADTSFTNQDP
jgi:hypothetical protein